MKYRSYNSEILIAATLMCDVFNDIIIDRRKNGRKRDYSKPITLSKIVQQKIDVPCIMGDRGIILKSLENEPGRYVLPLIVIQAKDLKTDTARMCDLHADIFYQQDNAFATLEETDKLYRPIELSKKRGQPININYDVTFITKYKEDLDQIISNFAVHFRPDIYLKWWHPRIKVEPLDSQLIWSHNISLDSSVDYNPQNVFVYKGTTSFTFKSWLFYGMDATDNTIDPALESIIKEIHIFPDKETDETALVIGDPENSGDGGSDNDDSSNEIGEKEKRGWGFYGVETGQEFYGTDPEKMKEGHYAVNNVFAEYHPEISGLEPFKSIKNNPLVGDFYSYEIDIKYELDKCQLYAMIDNPNLKNNGNSYVKNIFYKGSFPLSSFQTQHPSGDFMFRTFFSTQTNGYGQEKKAEFGESFISPTKMNLEYNINTKDLILWSNFDSREYSYYMKSKFNSSDGYFQEFEIKSKSFNGFDDYIAYSFHREFDLQLKNIEDKTIFNSHNIESISDKYADYAEKLYIDDYEIKKNLLDIRNFIKGHWKSIDLTEKADNIYYIDFKGVRVAKKLKNSEIYNVPFRALKKVGITTINDFQYHILTNKYIYIVLKINTKNEEECDVYDFGLLFPLKFAHKKAMIYEVTVPESREILGLNFFLGI